jgi:hypothetical protein
VSQREEPPFAEIADAMKFSMGEVVQICGPERLVIFVTDVGGQEPGAGRLREAGVEVVAA